MRSETTARVPQVVHAVRAHPHDGKDLLRFMTCGSVDDGKSTLIGRLLWEAKALFDDQLATLEADSKRVGTRGNEIDYALLLDGLSESSAILALLELDALGDDFVLVAEDLNVALAVGAGVDDNLDIERLPLLHLRGDVDLHDRAAWQLRAPGWQWSSSPSRQESACRYDGGHSEKQTKSASAGHGCILDEP